MKVDVSKIEGYAEMSAEEKLKALEEYEFEAPDNSNEVKNLKESLSRANSQAAEWKRQFREKQTETERAEAERAEREKETAEKLAAYERKFLVSDYTAQCHERTCGKSSGCNGRWQRCRNFQLSANFLIGETERD